MGNQQANAESMTEVLNEAITNVMMESSSKCGQNTSSIQTINFDDFGVEDCTKNFFGDISQESMQTINFSCANDAKNESELATAFANKLDQAASAKVSGMGGALNSESNSKVVADVKNQIVNNINMKNISECISNTVAEQTQNYKKIRFKCKMPGYCNTGCPPGYTCDESKCVSEFELRNIGQNLIQQATGTCTAKSENLSKIINAASSEIKQTSEATTKGIDPTMMSLMSALPSIIFACIFLSILYFLLQGGGEKVLNIAQGVKGL